MSSNFHQPSAKIYQFPKRGSVVNGRRGFEPEGGIDVRQKRPVNVESGSAWYHQTAIEESQRARKP